MRGNGRAIEPLIGLFVEPDPEDELRERLYQLGLMQAKYSGLPVEDRIMAIGRGFDPERRQQLQLQADRESSFFIGSDIGRVR